MVNLLYGQSTDRSVGGLLIEAKAADGLIEAFSASDVEAFTTAVQWHPEWKTSDNKDYGVVSAAFGDGCRWLIICAEWLKHMM